MFQRRHVGASADYSGATGIGARRSQSREACSVGRAGGNRKDINRGAHGCADRAGAGLFFYVKNQIFL